MINTFRKRVAVVCLGLFCSILFGNLAFAVDYPKYVGYVNDFENILTPADKAELEVTLKSFHDQTTNDVVVVTVSSFQGLDDFTYAQGIGMAWKLGTVENKNAVLFLVSKGERKMRIHVGKGLEGALPDSLSGRIMDREVIPSFKKDDYATGIKAGVAAIIQATKGEYKATGAAASSDASGNKDGGLITLIFFFGFMIVNYVIAFLARSKSWWLGGVLGGIGGGILGAVFLGGLAILITAGLFGGFGSVLDYVVSKNYQKRLKEGKPTDFWKSGGGFWFGGGGHGGSGGGFGGFGGGSSFGGGGASRGW